MFTKEKPYYSLSDYYINLFHQKVYKIPLDAGFTCPTRDGKIGTKGCIFCSATGSGDYAGNRNQSITEQIESGKSLLKQKYSGKKYIAYFQAFTNTYGPIDYLEKVYMEAISHDDIVGIAIGTRPDCLNRDIINLLDKINQIKKVWIELGLQTIHPSTASFIRRGYSLEIYDFAVSQLRAHHIDVIVHLIIGLPGETKTDILKSLNYVCTQDIQGIKLQMLHILKGTDLADLYEKNPFSLLSMEEYADLIVDCIQYIPKNIVIHRVTGDGPKKILLAPIWSSNKKLVLNTIRKRLKERSATQGDLV